MSLCLKTKQPNKTKHPQRKNLCLSVSVSLSLPLLSAFPLYYLLIFKLAEKAVQKHQGTYEALKHGSTVEWVNLCSMDSTVTVARTPS